MPPKKPLRIYLLRRFRYYYSVLTLGVYSFYKQLSPKRTLEYTGSLIDRGMNLIIFPEGERSLSGNLLPFHNGVPLLIKNLKVPVIPIGIIGLSYDDRIKLPPGRRKKVKVKFGKPIYFKKESYGEINSILRKEISKLIKR